MKIKNVVTVVLLIFIVASVAFLVFNESKKDKKSDSVTETLVNKSREGMGSAGGVEEPDKSGHKVIVYYFHGTRRCPTCRKFEEYTTELTKTAFARQLSSGHLEYHVVNVDEPQNKHFIYDYKLTTRSIIMADFQGEEQIRWKNLSRIWQLVRDKQVFMDYVRGETEGYLGELMYE